MANTLYHKHINKDDFNGKTWCGLGSKSWYINGAEKAALYTGSMRLCKECIENIEINLFSTLYNDE